MEKIISIGGREVGFKATATTVKRYREKFNKDLFKDIQNLIPKVNEQSLGANELECFMNIAYVMAWQYDHSIPEDPDDWLDQYIAERCGVPLMYYFRGYRQRVCSVFSPQIIGLWRGQTLC